MIPYDETLRLHQLEWYWANAILLGKVNGSWAPWRYRHYDISDTEDSERSYERCSVRAADEYGVMLVLESLLDTRVIRENPLALFERDGNWITYRPPLGYVKDGNDLLYLSHVANRSRDKGLTYGGARSNITVTSVPDGSSSRHAITLGLRALCRRLNEGIERPSIEDVCRMNPGDSLLISEYMAVVCTEPHNIEVHSSGRPVGRIRNGKLLPIEDGRAVPSRVVRLIDSIREGA